MAVVNKSTVTVNKPVVNNKGEVVYNRKIKFKKKNKKFVKQVNEDKKLIKSFENAYKQAENNTMDKVLTKEAPIQKVSVANNGKKPGYSENDLKESTEILNGFREAFDSLETEKRWKFTIKRAGQYTIKLFKDLGLDIWGIVANVSLTTGLLITASYKQIVKLIKK